MHSEKGASWCGVWDPPSGGGADELPEMKRAASDPGGEESVIGRSDPAGDAGGGAITGSREKGGRWRRPHGIEGERWWI